MPLAVHTSLDVRHICPRLHPVPDLAQVGGKDVGRGGNAACRLVLHGKLEIGIGAGQHDEIAAECGPEGTGQVGIVGGVLNPGKLDREGILQPLEQLDREPDPCYFGKVIPQNGAIGGDSLVDQFAVPAKEAVIGCCAEIVGGHDQRGFVAKIKGKPGQLDRLRQTGRPGAGDEAEPRQRFPGVAGSSHDALALARRERRTLTGRTEEHRAMTAA